MFVRAYLKTVFIFRAILFQILLLFVRFWMAMIFWNSGQSKLTSWDSTLLLFKEEYSVPYIPYELAAYLATATELICPILLIIGVATRFAVIPMLIMTAVIQFTYFNSIIHFYWGVLLTIILLYGPGKFSVDAFIRKKLEKQFKS